MKRQLQRALFLPINNYLLNNKEFDQYHPTGIKGLFSKARKYLNKRKDKNDFSIWEIMEKLKKNLKYEFILYPDNKETVDESLMKIAIQEMNNRDLILDIMEGNSLIDFERQIEKHNINIHNSQIIYTDREVLTQVMTKYIVFCHIIPNNNIQLKQIFGIEMFPLILPNREQFNETSTVHNTKLRYTLSWIFGYRSIVNANIAPPYIKDKVILIEYEQDNIFVDFINKNLDWIENNLRKKHCEFVFFDSFKDYDILKYIIQEYIKYNYPILPVKIFNNIFSKAIGIDKRTKTSLFLETLNFPSISPPVLLRNKGNLFWESSFTYSYYPLDTEKDLKEQFANYFELLESYDESFSYRLRADNFPNLTADDKFDIEANKLADDVIKKIETLKSHGMQSLVAEIALRLLNNMDEESLKQLGFSNNKQLTREIEQPTISRLRIEWVSKFDFRILLPDYGNLVVDMPRLPKAVFMLFLNHPEGILFKNLPIYKPELLQIYSRISNLSDTNEIENNIDRIVDPLDNSINVNCSRIKNAFVKLIDDKLAQNYYIKGWRGEPKLIELPRELIEIVDYQP